MQATTVYATERLGVVTILNCGTITQAEGTTTIVMDGQVATFDRIFPDPILVAQKFADLLTDVTE